MAGLEPGDLEARRADEMIAWGGAKRSPRYARRRVSAESAAAGLCEYLSIPIVSRIPSSAPSALILFKMILGLAAQAIVLVRLRRWLTWRPRAASVKSFLTRK